MVGPPMLRRFSAPWRAQVSTLLTTGQLGIGQRCILLRTEHGNVLWDCISFIDEKTIRYVRSML